MGRGPLRSRYCDQPFDEGLVPATGPGAPSRGRCGQGVSSGGEEPHHDQCRLGAARRQSDAANVNILGRCAHERKEVVALKTSKNRWSPVLVVLAGTSAQRPPPTAQRGYRFPAHGGKGKTGRGPDVGVEGDEGSARLGTRRVFRRVSLLLRPPSKRNPQRQRRSVQDPPPELVVGSPPGAYPETPTGTCWICWICETCVW